MVLDADYDARLGYPHRMENRLEKPFWGGVCQMLLIDPPHYKVTVVSLTPLPTLNVWQITPTPTPIPPTPLPFVATQPLMISGTSYPVPTDHSPRCIANGQAGDNTVEYNVNVPAGWVVIWDSRQAYWPGGQYENDGVLTVAGPWEGTIRIVNGQYCAFPSEWADFRPNNPWTAVPISKHCFVGAVENSGCVNK